MGGLRKERVTDEEFAFAVLQGRGFVIEMPKEFKQAVQWTHPYWVLSVWNDCLSIRSTPSAGLDVEVDGSGPMRLSSNEIKTFTLPKGRYRVIINVHD